MKAFLSVLAAISVFSIADAQDEKYSFKETYNVSAPASLDISSSDGNIQVMSSSVDGIEVHYIAKRNNQVLDINRQKLEEEVTLEVTHDRNNLKIVVKYPDKDWKLFGDERIQVDFRIMVPKETVCKLHTSDGNIFVTGLDGEQEYKTSDGNIRVKDIVGNVIAKTSDGNVGAEGIKGSLEVNTSDGNLNFTNIAGDIECSTSDGDISIINAEGKISSRTSDGHITFEKILGSFSGVTSDGNIQGNVVELNGSLTARTGDGNISIRIPGNLGLDLDIKGESLDIPLNNFSGTSGERSIHGKANGGGIPIILSASDGRIALVYE